MEVCPLEHVLQHLTSVLFYVVNTPKTFGGRTVETAGNAMSLTR